MRVSSFALKSPSVAAAAAQNSSLPTSHSRLQRKCTCGGVPGPSGECEECKRKRLALQPKLVVNQPGDQYEQEADRVAAAVVSGTASNRPSITSLGSGGAVQREEPTKPKTQEETYKEAAKKAGEAFLETPPGKEIKQKAEELGDAFVSTLPGKVITGAAVAGALGGVAALAATHKELPVGIPGIPLDKIKPGLKMKITYEGPADKPTKVMATFSFSLGGGKAREKKPAMTEREKFRAETARMAADQARFREGLKSDEEKAAEQRMLNAYVTSQMLRPDQLTPRSSPISFGMAGEQLGFHPGGPAAAPRTSLGSWVPDLKLTGETEAKEEPTKKEDETLQRKSAEQSEVAGAPLLVEEVLQTPGQPLEAGTRALMEERFGYDFGDVRIHRDGRAAESARAVDACAYTVGSQIVFDSNRYAPRTREGQRLLAHELTHVVQQQSAQAASSTLMRFGRTWRGFFANIFQFWDYSKEALLEYLQALDSTNRIQDDDDSDDMARQIVAEWKEDKSSYKLTPKLRVLLIREMLEGLVFKSDQAAILDLLEGSDNTELAAMFVPGELGLTYGQILAEFGVLKSRLQLFERRVLSKLAGRKVPDPAEARSLAERLGDVEGEQGIEFENFSVSFRLAPGTYYKSFAVDLKAEDSGVSVTFTVTRSYLHVQLSPALLVDVAWPIKNAHLWGFKLIFAGLRPTLEIEGIDLVTGTAKEKMTQYLQGLLAGTRFEKPGYNPMTDPNLFSEILDPEVVGDIDRVKYNFEKNLEPGKEKPNKGASEGKESTEIARSISDISYELNLVHQRGIPAPAEGSYGVVVEPGTKFSLSIATSGTAGELLEKNSRLQQVRVMSDGIFVYKGATKIVGLTSIELDRGLKVTLGGVRAYVDLKALAREEAPGWAKGTVESVTGVMEKYDETVDTFNAIVTLGGLLGRSEKSDVARDVGVKAAEIYLGGVVHSMLREQWFQIQSALGVTDEQIENFFGLGSGADEATLENKESRPRSKAPRTNSPAGKSLQRKEAGPARSSPETKLAPPIVHEALSRNGQPLQTATREFMEERFGHDFGRVRIHTGARAAESARAVSAHAYTVGDHVVFDIGRFAPETIMGRKLLAHELAHVVQQRAAGNLTLQRDDKPEDRIDVAIVFGDEADAMTEGKSYAPTAIRVTSGEDAKKKLLALGKPIGTIFVVSHSNRAGEVQVISGIGTISWVKLSDLSKDLKGMPAEKAPALIDFRGCKLGDAPQEMETFRQNVGAQKARGMTCWSIVNVVTPLVLPDGSELTDPSQIPKGKEGEVDAALTRQVNQLKSADGHAVKDCIEGLAKGETAAKNMAKIKKLYFAHKGNLAAVWASPDYNYDWQEGSMCVKDLTDKTSPCKITTTAAPAAAPGGGQKQQGAMLDRPAEILYAGPDRPVEEGNHLA